MEDLAYTLDRVGNPLSLTTPSRTEVYSYDEMNQLTNVCFQTLCPDPEDDQITYEYDLVGNRLTETRGDGTTSTTTTNCYATDGSDQLLGSTPFSTCVGFTPDHAYDDNGNLTSDATRDYTYDLANRVTSVDDGTTTYDYTYDAAGNRISSDDGTTSEELFWDTSYDTPLLAVSRTGAGDRANEYGHGLISTTDGTDDQYFLADRIGSVLHVTDSSADVDWSYEYEPFGEARSTTHVDMTAPSNDFRFAGEHLDPTGLINLRARQYDPAEGRFTSLDPVASPMDESFTSPYVYAANDPTRLIDPTGEFPVPGCASSAAPRSSTQARWSWLERCTSSVRRGVADSVLSAGAKAVDAASVASRYFESVIG